MRDRNQVLILFRDSMPDAPLAVRVRSVLKYSRHEGLLEITCAWGETGSAELMRCLWHALDDELRKGFLEWAERERFPTNHDCTN